jgi:hypothetical protein
LLTQLPLSLRKSSSDLRVVLPVPSQAGSKIIASGTGSEVSLVSLLGIWWTTLTGFGPYSLDSSQNALKFRWRYMENL